MGPQTDPQVDPQPQHCFPQSTPPTKKTREKPVFFAGLKTVAGTNSDQMGDEGLESPPQNPEENRGSTITGPVNGPTPAKLARVLQLLGELSPEQLAAALRLSELVGGR